MKAIRILMISCLVIALFGCNNDEAENELAPQTGTSTSLTDGVITLGGGSPTDVGDGSPIKSESRGRTTNFYENPEVQLQVREYRGSDRMDVSILNAVDDRSMSSDKRTYSAPDNRYVKGIPGTATLYDDYGTFTYKRVSHREAIPEVVQDPKRRTRLRNDNFRLPYPANQTLKEMLEDARRRGCTVIALGRDRYDLDCTVETAPHDPSVQVGLQVKMRMNIATSEIESAELFHNRRKVSDMSGNVARGFLNTSFVDQGRNKSIPKTIKLR